MDAEKLEKFLQKNGQPSFRLKQINQAIFQKGLATFSEVSTLSKDLRQKLENEIPMLSFEVEKILQSSDGDSIKALLKMSDGALVETVLISPKTDLWSACISCQVGCPMSCEFCATGSLGFRRNLTFEEITDQVLFWRQYVRENFSAKNPQLKFNIVYMGMGEPFANWENVQKSLKILLDENLFDFASRSISVSTVGISDGILDLAQKFPQVNLAWSLHFADDEKRSKYMPANRSENLEKMRETWRKYFSLTRRKVFVEYVMLKGVNDSIEDAQKLAAYLKSIGNSQLLHVNLINYNETFKNFSPSSKKQVQIFKQFLEKNGIKATVRKSLGSDIQGACGQLAAGK